MFCDLVLDCLISGTAQPRPQPQKKTSASDALRDEIKNGRGRGWAGTCDTSPKTRKKKQGGPGSVRFGYGLGMERFERFRFSVPAVPLRRGFLCVSAQFNREDGSGSGFGSWKTVPAVPVRRSVPAKTVPVSGSGSVPGPPWMTKFVRSYLPNLPSMLGWEPSVKV